MTAWPDLLATALIGTDRRPFEPGSADPAGALLEQAAAWSAYRRAGRLATTGLAAPTAAPAETRPVVPAASAARLADLLRPPDGNADIRLRMLRALLMAVADRGLRLPPESLPQLLEASRRDRELRSLVAAAGGERLRWLAAQNPSWGLALRQSTVDVSPDERFWHEGSLVQRAAYLRWERRSDPDAARARLSAEWAKLGPDERTELLGELRTGLGPADEPLIESALDDRRRDVRGMAQGLARALPGSAFNARALQRARACLVITGDSVEVALPTECDASMRRDGIEPRPPKGEGERTWWLRQIMANVPIAELTDVAPKVLLRLSDVDNVGARLRDGLADAAVAHRDSRWAAAILDHPAPTGTAYLYQGLLSVLTPQEQRRRLIALLRAEPSRATAAAITTLLRHVQAPWDDDLVAAVFELLAVRVGTPNWPYGDVCATAAFALPERAAPVVARIAERVHADHPENRLALTNIGRAAAVLYQRHQMIKELT